MNGRMFHRAPLFIPWQSVNNHLFVDDYCKGARGDEMIIMVLLIEAREKNKVVI